MGVQQENVGPTFGPASTNLGAKHLWARLPMPLQLLCLHIGVTHWGQTQKEDPGFLDVSGQLRAAGKPFKRGRAPFLI